MRTFIFRQLKLFIPLVLIALWSLLFPMWNDYVIKSPLDASIPLSPKGTVEKEVQIVIPEIYDLNLVFERANIPYEQLKMLLGDWVYKDGKPIPSGVRVPVRWTLTSLADGKIIVSGEIDSFGSTGWSTAEVTRAIGYIRVKSGKYLFRAEILRDVNEFKHIKTRIAMQHRTKTSSTWQMNFLFWGQLVTIFVLWPAALIIVFSLLCRWSFKR